MQLPNQDIPEGAVVGDETIEEDKEELSGGDEEQSNVLASPTPKHQLPVGPRIGKALILGDWINAVHALVLGDRFDHFASQGAQQDEEEGGDADSSHAPAEQGVQVKMSGLERARRLYASGAHPSDVLRWVPSTMVRERWVLQGLVRHNRNLFQRSKSETDGKPLACSCCSCCGISPENNGADTTRLRECDVQVSHRRAIETVPYGARLIWVHAYQSWLWNAVASHRLFRSGSMQPGEPRLGDLLDLQLLSPAQRSLLSDHHLVGNKCSGNNTRSVVEIDDLVLEALSAMNTSKVCSAITLPLIGTHVAFPSNESGRCVFSFLCFHLICTKFFCR
jgi:tRNA(Glu) U13 pseudouridine synthase TruD